MFKEPLPFCLVFVLVLVLVVLVVSVGGAVGVRTVLLLPLFRLVAEVGKEDGPNGLFKREFRVCPDEEVYEGGDATE